MIERREDIAGIITLENGKIVSDRWVRLIQLLLKWNFK